MELFAETEVDNLSTLTAHPAADLFPMLDAGEMGELAEDIKARGLIEAIVLDADGRIIDGRNRLEACAIAGVEPRFIEYMGDDVIGYIISKNLRRRHLNQSQKALIADGLRGLFEAEARARQGHGMTAPGKTLQENFPEAIGQARDKAGELLGVSGRTVDNAAFVKTAAPELVPRVASGEISLNLAKQAAELPEQERSAVASAPPGEVKTAAKEAVKRAHVANNSGNNEWYTPANIIEAARDVLGEIDLDPASCDAANEVVKATTYYTAQDNGLLQRWRGRVWMNPPYESGLVEEFTGKLRTWFEAGEVSEAIVLVNNATETRWFQNLADFASMICFPAGRVRFWNETKESASPLQGQAILYFGARREAFARRFREFGSVWERPQA